MKAENERSSMTCLCPHLVSQLERVVDMRQTTPHGPIHTEAVAEKNDLLFSQVVTCDGNWEG